MQPSLETWLGITVWRDGTLVCHPLSMLQVWVQFHVRAIYFDSGSIFEYININWMHTLIANYMPLGLGFDLKIGMV